MKNILDIIIPLIYFTGILVLFLMVYIISRTKQGKSERKIENLMEQSKESLITSDNKLKETLDLRKEQVENQKKIINLLEEINNKIKS